MNYQIHPYHNLETLEYDFAILRLENHRFIPNLKTVGVICLPIDYERTFVGEKMKIIGWGKTESGNSAAGLKFGEVEGFENSVKI